jgi:nucleoid DNA-binding protein
MSKKTDIELKGKVLPPTRLTTSTADPNNIGKDYTEFCRKTGVSKKVRVHHTKITNVGRYMNTCFNIISDQLLEKPGGVYIHNFGYFCILQRPKRKAIKYKNKYGYTKENFNTKTKSYVYNLVFIPVKHIRNSLSVWSMDRTFKRSVRMRLRMKLRSGVRYKNYIYTLSTSLKQRSNIQKFKGKDIINEALKENNEQ